MHTGPWPELPVFDTCDECPECCCTELEARVEEAGGWDEYALLILAAPQEEPTR